MKGLTAALLGQASRIFLTMAYPQGEHTIPPSKSAFLAPADQQTLETLLAAPVCQPLNNAAGSARGYAFRLGSAVYPHLKMQAVNCDHDTTWVFAVDTHDAMRLEANHPDAARWGQLQVRNRALKQQIEQAWEAAGILTFNGLLRRDLDRQ